MKKDQTNDTNDTNDTNELSKQKLISRAVATALTGCAIALTGCGGSSDLAGTSTVDEEQVSEASSGDSAQSDTSSASATTAEVTIAARSAATENSDALLEDNLVGNLMLTVRDRADGSVVTTVISGSDGYGSLDLEPGEYAVWAEDPNGVYAPSYCNVTVDESLNVDECTVVLTGAPATATIRPFSDNPEDRTVYGSDLEGVDDGLKLVFPQSQPGDYSFYYEDLSQAVAEYDGRVNLSDIEYLRDSNAEVVVAVRLVDLTQLENHQIFPGFDLTQNQSALVPGGHADATIYDLNGNVIDSADIDFAVDSSTMLIVAMTHDGRRLEPVPGKFVTSTTPIFGNSSTLGEGQFSLGDQIHSSHLAGGDTFWESEAVGEVVACENGDYELCATFEVPRFCAYHQITNSMGTDAYVANFQVGEAGESCDISSDAGCLEYQVSMNQVRPADISIPGTVTGTDHLTTSDALYDTSGLDFGEVLWQDVIGLFPTGTTFKDTLVRRRGTVKAHRFNVPGFNNWRNRGNTFTYYSANIWNRNAVNNVSISPATGLGPVVTSTLPIRMPVSQRCTNTYGSNWNDCRRAKPGIVTDQRWLVNVTVHARVLGGEWEPVANQQIANYDSNNVVLASIPQSALSWSFERSVNSDGSISLTLQEENRGAYVQSTSTNTIAYPVTFAAP